jgi:hypothetical protein
MEYAGDTIKVIRASSSSLMIFVVMLALGVTAAVLVAFLVFRRRANAQSSAPPAQYNTVTSSGEVRLSNYDGSRFTMFAVLQINNFTKSAKPKVLLSWGILRLILQKDSNDMFVALYKNAGGGGGGGGGSIAPGVDLVGGEGLNLPSSCLCPAAAVVPDGEQTPPPASGGGGGGGGGGGVPGDTVEEQDKIKVLYNYLNNFHCMYEVQDIPFYRAFTMHVVYDYGQRYAKVYIDGKLAKICNLYICPFDIPQASSTQTILLRPEISVTPQTGGYAVQLVNPSTSSNDVNFISIGIRSGIVNDDSIAREAEDAIKKYS